MRKTRVMVVDDSVVIRRLLTDIINSDPKLEVAATAPNGRIALAKLPQVNPDVVTLDVEMPELNGLETLPKLRKLYPDLPVIMFSTLTERGAAAAVEALARGASDYVAKPAKAANASVAIQRVRDELIPKIKALGSVSRPAEPPRSKPIAAPRSIARFQPHVSPQIDALLIGASTGGPQALTRFLSALPADFPVPIAVVQHMPPVFTRCLAQRLNQECAIEVLEAAGGEFFTAGRVFIAPGAYHLELRRCGALIKTHLHQQPPENSCRPAVDVLFRSAAALFGPRCLGVILTGMGQDGLRGAEAIVRAGGAILAQDEATSVVWGMPRAVAQAGLARKVLPLSELADEATRLCCLGRPALLPVGATT